MIQTNYFSPQKSHTKTPLNACGHLLYLKTDREVFLAQDSAEV
jgi:hypothetical protein